MSVWEQRWHKNVPGGARSRQHLRRLIPDYFRISFLGASPKMEKRHCPKSMCFHAVFVSVKTMVWLRVVISVSKFSGLWAKACPSGRQGSPLKIEIHFQGTGFAGHATPKSIAFCAHRFGFKQMKQHKCSKHMWFIVLYGKGCADLFVFIGFHEQRRAKSMCFIV